MRTEQAAQEQAIVNQEVAKISMAELRRSLKWMKSYMQLVPLIYLWRFRRDNSGMFK